MLAALASELPAKLGAAGLAHAALPALEAQLYRFAWLGSVKGLDEPSPRLIEHAASWWSWTQFAVSSWPAPAVRRLTDQDRGVPVPEHGPTWWRTDRLVEAVAYPSDVAALAGRLAAGLEARRCRWCVEPIAAAPCPFCGASDHDAGSPLA